MSNFYESGSPVTCSGEEVTEVVKRIVDDPREYPVEVGGYSWKNKAEEFERVLDEVAS